MPIKGRGRTPLAQLEWRRWRAAEDYGRKQRPEDGGATKELAPGFFHDLSEQGDCSPLRCCVRDINFHVVQVTVIWVSLFQQPNLYPK